MSIRKSCAFAVCLATTSLGGCFGGDSGPEVRSQEYEAYCVTCHELDGRPTFMGPIGVQLGPNSCKKVSCSDEAALTQYIDSNMPPRSSVCIGECAESTARFIVANFKASKAGAAELNANAVLSALENLQQNAQITAYDQSTGNMVDLESLDQTAADQLTDNPATVGNDDASTP